MISSDPMLSYVLAARPLHAALREAVIQLAGLALLRATSPVRAAIDISPLDRARAVMAEPADGIAALHVPAAAAHHHYHLNAAVASLERALAAGFSTRTGAEDGFFAAVENAERHIRAAGRLLPGFEIVDLTQACCAMHATTNMTTLLTA